MKERERERTGKKEYCVKVVVVVVMVILSQPQSPK